MSSTIARRTFLRHSLSAAGAAAVASVANAFGAKRSDAELKAGLVRVMKERGAYDVRIADPRTGFEHALSMPNPFRVEAPKKLWPECRSIIVAIAPYPPVLDNHLPAEKREAQRKGLNSGSTEADKSASFNVYHPLTIQVMSRAFVSGWQFLVRSGYQVKADVAGVMVQGKLAAYEAGIGVYGRSGLILHPELGNRMVILTLMTDAVLPPDGRLTSFTTNCKKCGICVKTCRGRCYRADKDYPSSYTVTACAQSRNEVLMQDGGLCQNCFSNCPASKKSDDELAAWLTAHAG